MSIQRLPGHVAVFAAATLAAAGAPAQTNPAPDYPLLPLTALRIQAAPPGPSPTWGVAQVDAPAAFCFAPGTDPAVISQFRAAMDAVGPRSNPVDRWQTTAHGATGPDGTPITLTYSFVPDGTSIPASSWSSGGASTLHAFLTDIHGSSDAWHVVIHEAFQRWTALTGITFVHEPNDDGVPLSASARGILGVRGDIRISAIALDGAASVLAYNYYPDYGDMVLDAGDSWFDSSATSPRGLQNLIVHEVGHGIGLAHVCPVQNRKIMEPFITSSFYGPQHDDIRGAQFLYGDVAEPDNTPMQATDLGELPLDPILIGAPPPPSVTLGATRSIMLPGDEDWFRFTVDASSTLLLTLVPLGTSYYEGDQDCPDNLGDCCRGVVIDSRTMSDLSVRVLDAGAAIVLAEADSAEPGLAEHIPEVVLQPGAYHVRITGNGQLAEPQLYTLTLARDDIEPACPCEADGRADAVDVFDLLVYLDDWFAQSPAAEWTGDDPAAIDVFDLLGYLDCWFPASVGTPCP